MFDLGQQLTLPELPWMLLSGIGMMTLFTRAVVAVPATPGVTGDFQQLVCRFR